MIPYAVRTDGARNLAALRRAQWRLLLTAGASLVAHGFPYALDNGAWGSHQRGDAFDVPAFEAAVERVGAGADFIVAPDIVCGGLPSLSLSLSFLAALRSVGPPILLPVQPGMDFGHLRGHVEPGRVGVFLGGDTAWKEAAILTWGPWAHRLGVWCHVGRVNTARRIALCGAGRVTSFDGSNATRFSCNLPRLDNARRQLALVEA